MKQFQQLCHNNLSMLIIWQVVAVKKLMLFNNFIDNICVRSSWWDVSAGVWEYQGVWGGRDARVRASAAPVAAGRQRQ